MRDFTTISGERGRNDARRTIDSGGPTGVRPPLALAFVVGDYFSLSRWPETHEAVTSVVSFVLLGATVEAWSLVLGLHNQVRQNSMVHPPPGLYEPRIMPREFRDTVGSPIHLNRSRQLEDADSRLLDACTPHPRPPY
jgi:hypothetical protein